MVVIKMDGMMVYRLILIGSLVCSIVVLFGVILVQRKKWKTVQTAEFKRPKKP